MRSGLILLFVLLGATLPGTPVWAQSPPKPSASPAASAQASDEQKAEGLFRKAKALYAQEKFEEAYVTYKEAFGLHKRYDIAGNLGNVAFELGKMRDAAEYLTYCVRNFPSTGSTNVRAGLEKKLDGARKQVGTVSLVILEKNCQVFVDGELVWTDQVAASPVEVFLTPGAHTIEAKCTGFESTPARIHAEAGSVQKIDLQIRPKAEKASRIGPKLPRRDSAAVGAAQPEKPQKSQIPIFVGAGVSAAFLATGIGLTVAANAKDTEADTLLFEMIATQSELCPQGHPRCGELKDLRRQKDIFHNAAVGTYIGAGIGAVATVAYVLFWPVLASPSSTATRVIVVPSPWGIQVAGTF